MRGRGVVGVLRHLMVAAALLAPVAQVGAQPALVEIWRDPVPNWSGKRHAPDAEGNLLVVGDTVIGDILQVRKYSPAGQLLWSSIYDPPERVVSYWIATDPAGNAWVAAARITGSSNTRVGFLTLKYDPQGNLLFVDATAGGLAVRVVTDAAGNAYVIGNGWGPAAPADIYMVVKIAPDGRRLWTGFLESGSSTFLALARSVALSPDQTRLVVAGGNIGSAWQSLSVAMFDTASGRRLWNHLDTTRSSATDVAFASDGASLYAGSNVLTPNNTVMALHRFDLAGNRLFSRTYPDGRALIRMAVDGSGNVVFTGDALPLPGSPLRDWMTIKTNAAGTQLWSRRYDASGTADEVPSWVAVDDAGAVYVAGLGGPSPATGNTSFLRPVTLKYDAAGTQVWANIDAGDAQVTVDANGSAFTLGTGQMTSVRFEQTGATNPPPAAPTALSATLSTTALSETVVRLAWADNSDDENQFAVERCVGAGCSTFSQIGISGANVTGSVDSFVTSGQSYTYRVRAWSGTGGYSGYSNLATLNIPLAVPPVPAMVSAGSSIRRQIDVAWINMAPGATAITVERCRGTTCTSFVAVAQLAGTATFWTDARVRSGATYRYRLFASNAAGRSDYSNIASATAR
jgi:hypothetical protein